MTSERMADLPARLASMEPGLVENSLHYLLIKSRVFTITEDGSGFKKFDELMRRDNFLDQVAAKVW